MKKQTIGMIKVEGNSIYIGKPELLKNEIKWENINVDFQKDFIQLWENTIELVETDNSANHGLNILSVLDTIAYRINNNLLSKEVTFNIVYKEIVSEILKENFDIAI